MQLRLHATLRGTFAGLKTKQNKTEYLEIFCYLKRRKQKIKWWLKELHVELNWIIIQISLEQNKKTKTTFVVVCCDRLCLHVQFGLLGLFCLFIATTEDEKRRQLQHKRQKDVTQQVRKCLFSLVFYLSEGDAQTNKPPTESISIQSLAIYFSFITKTAQTGHFSVFR